MRKAILISIQCAAVILAGLIVMWGLASLKEPPKRVELKEQPIHVTVLAVQPESLTVTVSGYGTVRNLNTVAIAPEVAGILVEVNPHLDKGQVIPKGETLFVIDPRTYEQQLKGAEALAGQLESGLAMLGTKHSADEKRMEGAERTRDLAKGEYSRVKGLFEKKVGAQHGVEIAEGAYIEAEDIVTQLRQALDSYPEQRKEMENRLAAARAQVEQARLAFERTKVVAPFDARVKMVGSGVGLGLEVNQYVTPAVPVLTLADDSVLEVSVPLDSSEARQWLVFEDAPQDGKAWFDKIEAVECTVKWTEDDKSQWKAVLDRVEGFDERTRTLTVAVRMTGEQAAASAETALPLVDGMFCEVTMPGRQAENVFRIPRKAVNFDGTLYLNENGHLKTVKVKVVHEQGNDALVSEGLKAGDQVITTRLVNPMENALLETEPEAGGGPSS